MKWYNSVAYLSDRARSRAGRHYWDGKFTLMPQSQHVYNPEDIRPEFVPFSVPRLGPVYDFSGFWDFPTRMGWKVRRYDRRCHEGRCLPGVCQENDGLGDGYGMQTPSISRDGTSEPTVFEKVAFLQSWLFFGALAEACIISGLTVDNRIFSTDVFNTAFLNGLPLRLFAAAQQSRRAGSKELREKLYCIIRLVQLMITRSQNWEDEHVYDWEQCQVLFSIRVLLRMLSLALLCHSRLPHLDRQEALKFSVADVATDWKPEGQISLMSFIHDRLAGKGWCKVEILNILQTTDVALFAYALDRPHSLRNHERCTDTTCCAYQVDDQDYRTVHVNSDCDCPSLCVEPTVLRNFLGRNRIPAVLISEDLKLSVVDADETTFVAISHVWADGLGNPVQNALPVCQVRRLKQLITAVCRKYSLQKSGKGQIALWIDTLCIPVAPELKEFRKLAIRMLARTYKEASSVLVLDRELCQFESGRASILELSIRIGCSGWLKRLWTLQEASLTGTEVSINGSGTLYIQMADGPAHWNRLSHSFQYKPDRRTSRCQELPLRSMSVPVQEVRTDLVHGMHLLAIMEDRLPSVWDIQEPRFTTRFEKIASAVQNRSTSKREDEPICLASLLGLGLADILQVDDADERMARFYTLLREIPSAIIFSEFGVPHFLAGNLTRAPFRWAPRSLLLLERPMEISIAIAAMRFADPPFPLLGVCKDDGLHIQHRGFVFHSEDIVLPRNFVLIEQESGEKYQLSLALSDMSPVCIGPVERCAMVFKTDITSDAVIVRIDSEAIQDGIKAYYVAIVGHATNNSLRNTNPTASDTVGEARALAGLITPRDQKWCFT